MKMRKKKETYYALPIIFTVILIILVFIFFSTSSGEGTLILWIKNYNHPCTSNNTSICDKSAFIFQEIYIDGRYISNGTTLYGGMIWKTNLSLHVGIHSFKIIQKIGTISNNNIRVEKNKVNCYQIPWFNDPGPVPVNINVDACPP
jgi:hypothetical protein